MIYKIIICLIAVIAGKFTDQPVKFVHFFGIPQMPQTVFVKQIRKLFRRIFVTGKQRIQQIYDVFCRKEIPEILVRKVQDFRVSRIRLQQADLRYDPINQLVLVAAEMQRFFCNLLRE